MPKSQRIFNIVSNKKTSWVYNIKSIQQIYNCLLNYIKNKIVMNLRL